MQPIEHNCCNKNGSWNWINIKGSLMIVIQFGAVEFFHKQLCSFGDLDHVSSIQHVFSVAFGECSTLLI